MSAKWNGPSSWIVTNALCPQFFASSIHTHGPIAVTVSALGSREPLCVQRKTPRLGVGSVPSQRSEAGFPPQSLRLFPPARREFASARSRLDG